MGPVKGNRGYRNFNCENYNRCLEYACKNNWPGFSCHKCNGMCELGDDIISSMSFDLIQFILAKKKVVLNVRNGTATISTMEG